MKNEYLPTLESLVSALSKLPGVGTKTAERYAFSILDMDAKEIEELASSIQKAKSNIHPCPNCGLLTEDDECSICKDENRDHSLLCVITSPKDFFPIEKSRSFHGVYHVLKGTIAISKGMDAEDIGINQLLKRIEEEKFKEIILATEPTLDGETTALYIANCLKNTPIQLSRLAYGLSLGSRLEYVDTLTMERAFEGRRKL